MPAVIANNIDMDKNKQLARRLRHRPSRKEAFMQKFRDAVKEVQDIISGRKKGKTFEEFLKGL